MFRRILIATVAGLIVPLLSTGSSGAYPIAGNYDGYVLAVSQSFTNGVLMEEQLSEASYELSADGLNACTMGILTGDWVKKDGQYRLDFSESYEVFIASFMYAETLEATMKLKKVVSHPTGYTGKYSSKITAKNPGTKEVITYKGPTLGERQ